MDKSRGNQLGAGFPFPDQVENRFYGNDIGENRDCRALINQGSQ